MAEIRELHGKDLQGNGYTIFNVETSGDTNTNETNPAKAGTIANTHQNQLILATQPTYPHSVPDPAHNGT